jgi:hypothetical protein
MMRAKGKATFLDAMKEAPPVASPASAAAAAAKEALKEDEWEVRPGGMLVQKRTPDADAPGAAPVPTIRVKVKHAGVCHEIYISSQASFGELKKMLSAKTGLHHEDQKLVYKDRERDSKAFLDMAGVKDRSKMVLLEDPAAQAKRLLEQRRADKAQRAAKSVSRISLDVDKLATKVRYQDSCCPPVVVDRSSLAVFDRIWGACRCRRWRPSWARAGGWWRRTWWRSPRR